MPIVAENASKAMRPDRPHYAPIDNPRHAGGKTPEFSPGVLQAGPGTPSATTTGHP
ncbi:MAG: hypothetical protein HRT89_07135 [Lentisphaeria bacterium]|nr:hypothetical protein [Lentisphaeria bacterium]